MLLLIDIGNTNITTGFYEDGIKNVMRLDTAQYSQYIKRLKDFISYHEIKKPHGAIIGSVVPRVEHLFMRLLKEHLGLEPMKVSPKLKTGLKFCIEKPEQLGADRIANVVAASQLYKGHLIVIDFGTATTFSVVSAKREYRGGAIMPGLEMSLSALAKGTAKLPEVELKVPRKILGQDTEGNILSGVVLGHAGAVERIIREIKRELKNPSIKVVATGGFASFVLPYLKGINQFNPLLTLEGLRIIYELNSSKKSIMPS
jgi:type III pantothenate kinase